jgi:hypothetical protein
MSAPVYDPRSVDAMFAKSIAKQEADTKSRYTSKK